MKRSCSNPVWSSLIAWSRRGGLSENEIPQKLSDEIHE